jgi:hypothetical protein
MDFANGAPALDNPAFVTALRDLRLKREKTKGSVAVWIIDRVQEASAN